jgi:hypothetical protein
MPDRLTIALRVDGAVDCRDPAAALLEVTGPLVRTLLAHMDQVGELRTADPEVLTVDRRSDQLTWLVDVDPRLDDNELLDHAWAVLEGDRLTAIQAAIASDPQLQADYDGSVLVCWCDGLSWRCYPKHGDEIFTTPELRRDTLTHLLAQLG